MNEIWKDIEGYERLYQVSNFGRIKSVERCYINYLGTTIHIKERIKKPRVTKYGYVVVNLSKNGKYETKFVHRLVACAFIENKDDLPQINHKDENKSNNVSDNLEWCTSSYNANYGTRNERSRKNKMKPVNQYTKDGEFIRSWESISTVQRETGMSLYNISMACTGKIKTAFGYIWKYKED